MQNLDQFDQESTFKRLEKELLCIYDLKTTEIERIQEIMNDKYCRADLKQLTQECDELTKEKKTADFPLTLSSLN